MIELREAILFEMMCDPPARMWSGVGNLVIDGDTYLGGGELMDSFPELQQLINYVASAAEFVVSGVDDETIRLAFEDRDSVEGAVVRIGTVPMNANWQVSGPIEWEWEGKAEIVTVDRTGDPEGGVTRSITLSVGSEDTARSRLQLTLFTDAEQRKRSPDDSFFSNVAAITNGTSRRFEAAS